MRKAGAPAASVVRRTARARGRSSVAARRGPPPDDSPAGSARLGFGCWPAGFGLPCWPPAPLLGFAPPAWPGLPPWGCALRLALPGGGFLPPGAGFLPAATLPCLAAPLPWPPFLAIFSSRCFMASPCDAIMASMKRLRFLGLALARAASSSGLGIVRRMISCWPMVQTLVVTQYTNRPAGKLNRKSTKMIGIARMIHFCVLSVCVATMSSVEIICVTT